VDIVINYRPLSDEGIAVFSREDQRCGYECVTTEEMKARGRGESGAESTCPQ